jgi:hypothetical protein
MAFEQVKIWEIVDRAVNHDWSIPEFQRGFVWKSTQVRDLAESLWLNFPIGSLLLWNARTPVEEQIARDGQAPSVWLVDGQQRATALCALFGRKPYWWSSAEEWNRLLQRYDIRFDIDAKEAPFFWVANAAIRKVRGHRYVPLQTLLNLDLQREQDQKALMELAKAIKQEDLCHGMDSMEVYTRLDRVRKIRELDVVTITVDHELEDVVEIFSRLNSKGTRVTEADIYLGVVAARNPGWVRKEFMPFLSKLEDAGFDISPNLLFRSLTGVGMYRARFREVSDWFWNEDQIRDAWANTEKTWVTLVHRFKQYGILSSDLMPTQTALVTMIALLHKFPEAQFEPMLAWFLTASRFNRYSGSATTTLTEDLRAIQESQNASDALEKLNSCFSMYHQEYSDEDFLRDYSDARYGRFLLYLLVYDRKAIDWDESDCRIGFEGTELLEGFRPQFHHIFPVKYLQRKVDDKDIHALANIAVIGPRINIKIGAQDPLKYVVRYKISSHKLEQQLIDSTFTQVSVDQFPDWLQNRAKRLATAANAFLERLRKETK